MKNQDLDKMIKLLKNNREKFIVILKEIFEENKITKNNKMHITTPALITIIFALFFFIFFLLFLLFLIFTM